MTSKQLAAIERLRELEKKATPGKWWIDESGEICSAVPLENKLDKRNIVNQSFICALRNEALPLIEALQTENEYLKSEAQRTDKAFSEALKDLVLSKRESKRFGNQVVLAVNKGCELQAENQRLREGIGRAVDCLRRDCESFGELSSAVCDAQEQLEALHDA